MNKHYKHKQIGTYILVGLGLLILFFAGLVGLGLLDGIGGNMLANRTADQLFAFTLISLCVWLAIPLILLICAVLFASLTIEIDATSLAWSFGPGLIHKAVPLREIESVIIVQNPWYYGWGIHSTSHGWLYNVSGSAAVELRLKNGKQLRLGTDEPEELLQALQNVLATQPR